jgi:acetylornithine deacetylase/succinyl-diaminopimelate desuccinylase-like protein
VDPFGAVLKDGYIWGRGSVDFMTKQHSDQIDAEFALTEGGSGTLENGCVTVVQIQTTEKVPRETHLVVRGTSGHGSVPRGDNALIHLSAAVAKVGSWETPMRLNDTTRTYFEKLAAISPPDRAAPYNGLLDPKRAPAIQRYLAVNEPQRYSMLRTSIVPTILKAGFRVNVIPSEAEATLDVRALPDEDMDKLYAEMQKVIGDSAVKIERVAGNERPAGGRAIPPRYGDVPGPGASGEADVSGSDGSARDVYRRDRHGATASQGNPVLRHRAGANRRRRHKLRRPQRRGAPDGIVAL